MRDEMCVWRRDIAACKYLANCRDFVSPLFAHVGCSMCSMWRRCGWHKNARARTNTSAITITYTYRVCVWFECAQHIARAHVGASRACACVSRRPLHGRVSLIASVTYDWCALNAPLFRPRGASGHRGGCSTRARKNAPICGWLESGCLVTIIFSLEHSTQLSRWRLHFGNDISLPENGNRKREPVEIRFIHIQ